MLKNKKNLRHSVTKWQVARTNSRSKKKMTLDEYQKEAEEMRPSLIAKALSYLSNRDEAEDAVQDTLLRLWEMRGDIRSPMAPLAHVIVKRLCIDRLRKAKLTTDVGAVNIECEEDNHEAIDRIMSIIHTLPITQQTVMQLRHVDGMDMTEIASIMGMTEATVRKTLSRARIAIRQKYAAAISPGSC